MSDDAAREYPRVMSIRGHFNTSVVLVVAGLVLGSVGCSGGDNGKSASGGDADHLVPTALSDVDRQVLNESVADGHGDLVAAAGDDPEVCAALKGAVDASKDLDSASGEDLVALLGPSQAPMDQAAAVLAAKGFNLTAEHYGRYRDALVATEADIDMGDQASRDRANERFAEVQGLGAGTTATELGGLALVCGIA